MGSKVTWNSRTKAESIAKAKAENEEVARRDAAERAAAAKYGPQNIRTSAPPADLRPKGWKWGQ